MPYRAVMTAALQSLGLYVSGLVIPLFGQIAMLFAPVPLVLLFARSGRAAGTGALLLSASVAAALAWDQTAVLLFFMSSCLTALGLSEGILRRMKPERSVFLGGVLPFAAVCISLSVVLTIAGKSPVVATENYLRSQLAIARDIYARLGLTDLVTAVSQISDPFIFFVTRLLPGMALSAVLLQSVLCYGAARMLLVRRSPDAAGMFPSNLALWHAPDTMVWGLIGTLAFIAWGVIEPARTIPYFLGLNLFIVYALLYAVQGIAVVHFALRKARNPLFWRVLLIILIIVSLPFVALTLSILGILDIWADFRKVRMPAGAA